MKRDEFKALVDELASPLRLPHAKDAVLAAWDEQAKDLAAVKLARDQEQKWGEMWRDAVAAGDILRGKIETLGKELVLANARADAVGSQMLDLQRDCVAANKALAEAHLRGFREGVEAAADALSRMSNGDVAYVGIYRCVCQGKAVDRIRALAAPGAPEGGESRG